MNSPPIWNWVDGEWREEISMPDPSLPFVSCLMPTYNRYPDSADLVGEAVESFLRQEYPLANRELVILNDCSLQEVVCNLPNVRVFNTIRFKSLGEKRNSLVSLSKGDVLLPWDDDDISLPNRISQAVDKILGSIPKAYRSAERIGQWSIYWNPHRYWFRVGDGPIEVPTTVGYSHNCSAFTRAAFEIAKGYPETSGDEDMGIDKRLRSNEITVVDGLDLLENRYSSWNYIYRWGVSPRHLSGVKDCNGHYKKIGELPVVPGRYVIVPGWKEDYDDMVRRAALNLHRLPCVHLRGFISTDKDPVPIRECTVHSKCTQDRIAPGIKCCALCIDYTPSTPLKPLEKTFPPVKGVSIPDRNAGEDRKEFLRSPVPTAKESIENALSAIKLPGGGGILGLRRKKQERERRAIEAMKRINGITVRAAPSSTPDPTATTKSSITNPTPTSNNSVERIRELSKRQGGITLAGPRRDPVWTYGVTTVLSRINTTLPITLANLSKAGFPRPVLFLDGATFTQAEEVEKKFGLEVEVRRRKIRAYGNWYMGMQELYLRAPTADRYAIFQDDFVTVRGLREYLDAVELREGRYFNLLTFPENEDRVPRDPPGNKKGDPIPGFYLSNQLGKGAVALVFDRKGVMTVLAHQHMIQRVGDSKRGHCYIDGGVVDAMKGAGYKEYVHYPSLVKHIGKKSTISPTHDGFPDPESFPGEDFDIRTLLPTSYYDKTTPTENWGRVIVSEGNPERTSIVRE
jgi:glycosyltransferase involved in cell wall biosynthesis